MSNLVINAGTWSDTATIQAVGNERAETPATNLQKIQASDIWQSNGLTTLFFELQLTPAEAWDMIALLYTNLTLAATWRIRAADTQGNLTLAPAFDSGSLTFVAAGGDLTWSRRHGFYRHTTTITQPWLRIDLADGANPDGDVRAGRLMVETSFQPQRNMQLPYSLGWLDASPHAQALGQQTFVRALPTQLAASLDLRWLTKAEAFGAIYDFDRRIGSGKPILFILDPDETTYRHHQIIYGFVRAGQLIQQEFFPRFRKRYEIEEAL